MKRYLVRHEFYKDKETGDLMFLARRHFTKVVDGEKKHYYEEQIPRKWLTK